jgi:hypothetical protein
MDLLQYLVLGSYIYTSMVIAVGARAFWYLYRQIMNHTATRIRSLEVRVDHLEHPSGHEAGPDC